MHLSDADDSGPAASGDTAFARLRNPATLVRECCFGEIE
jgi:hypothetical protein